MLRLSVAAIVSLFSFNALAADFTRADALFVKRADGAAATQAARAAYDQLLPGLSNADLVYAVSRIGQLDIYAGDVLLPKSAKEERRAIFNRCFDDALLKIKPELVGETPQFYYWRGTCLAFWAESASPIERLMKVQDMKKMIAGGLALDRRYYGGGILRLAAGLYSNPMARPVGLYNPDDALVKVTEALAGAAYPGDANDGSSYYANARYKVETLRELNRKSEALELATTAIAEIEELTAAGALPIGIEPETAFELGNLRVLKAALEQ